MAVKDTDACGIGYLDPHAALTSSISIGRMIHTVKRWNLAQLVGVDAVQAAHVVAILIGP